MNDRQRARLERFRGSLIDRVRRITAGLTGQGEGKESDLQQASRDLHTFKGDARMLGLTEVAELAHAAEPLLELDDRATRKRVVSALDLVIVALEGKVDDLAATRALSEAARSLRAETSPPGEGAAAPHTPPLRDPSADSRTAPGEPTERWTSVNTRRVDEISDSLAEFASEFRTLQRRVQAATTQGWSRHDALELVEAFDRAGGRLNEITQNAWALRLVLVDSTLQDLARHARELAGTQHKRLRTVVRSGDTQLERSIVDDLHDPLLHLVRNAIDHGVEEANGRRGKAEEAELVLSAEPVGPLVRITVSDDGRGIDTEAVRQVAVERGFMRKDEALNLDEHRTFELLLRPGFSTRHEVSEVSGRGIGLDVVRHAVERLGGTLRMTSQPGAGTQFVLEVPAQVGKERALLVPCAGGLYGLPSRTVREVLRFSTTSEPLVEHGADRLRLHSFAAVLGDQGTELFRFVLIVELAGRHWAFGVPALLGERELVRRPLDPLLSAVGHVGASATLDDGRLVLLVSLQELVRRTGDAGTIPTQVLGPEDPPALSIV